MDFIMAMKDQNQLYSTQNGLHHGDEDQNQLYSTQNGLHHGDEDQNQPYSTQKRSSSW
jgi:hypothetical protein